MDSKKLYSYGRYSCSKGDFAQAKATLNSIIESYTGDPDLVELAKQKLEQIEEMENRARKIKSG